MEIGGAMFFTDYAMPAGEFAAALEARGFGSLWAPEHSHIPTSRQSPFPPGGDLPKEYYECMDPFVSLTLAAGATKTLKLGTGICLVTQRDPIQTAKLVASIDQVSQGRFLFGVGNGWNAEEMADHGTDFASRHKLARERIEAMKLIWTQTKAEYHGEFVNFPEMMAWPKPVQKPHPPLWQTAGSPKSFRAAGRRGVGILALTILNPVSTMAGLLAEYEAGLAECVTPVGHLTNRQKAVFTFVHVAESRRKAIDNGAALAALWYVIQGPKNFETPLSAYFSLFGGGVNPRSLGSDDYKRPTADPGVDPTVLTPEPGDNELVAIVKKMARGDEVSREEAHETLEAIDSVVIGDPDHCLEKFRRYQAVGTDRMMCMMQFGDIAQSEVLRSIALVAEHHMPACAAPLNAGLTA